MSGEDFKLGMILILIVIYYLVILHAVFDFKLDKTKDGKLLLWYNHQDEETKEISRKFIRIY